MKKTRHFKALEFQNFEIAEIPVTRKGPSLFDALNELINRNKACEFSYVAIMATSSTITRSESVYYILRYEKLSVESIVFALRISGWLLDLSDRGGWQLSDLDGFMRAFRSLVAGVLAQERRTHWAIFVTGVSIHTPDFEPTEWRRLHDLSEEISTRYFGNSPLQGDPDQEPDDEESRANHMSRLQQLFIGRDY